MKKTKTGLIRAVRGILFLLALAAVVLYLDRALKLVQEDNLSPRYFTYPKDTFDVAFLGASLVMYGIYPMELYDAYGMAAYNLSTGNQSLEASYYLAKEVIEKDHPSLIVLDCSRALDDEESMEPQYIHYLTDTMPYLDRNRLDMIRALSAEGEDIKPLLFPLIAFHSRWQELTFEDALPQTKGMVYGAKVTGRVEVSESFREPKIRENVLTDTSRSYIEKTIELCRENDTQLLLLTMPVIGKNKFFDQHGFNQRASAAAEVAALAKEHGLLHLNYLGKVEELGLDLQTDAYDGEHLNRWGASKLTALLGQFIKDNYEIPDRRGTGGAYAKIEEDLAVYPVSRMKDSLRRSLFLRDYAATLKTDACDDPVEDAVVLVALNGRVDDTILTEQDAALLQSFGLTQDLHDWEGHGYIAVIDGGHLVYESSPAQARAAGQTDADAGTQAEQEAEVQAEPEVGVQADPDTEKGSAPDAGDRTGAETDVPADPDTEDGAAPGTDEQAASGAEDGPETAAEADAPAEETSEKETSAEPAGFTDFADAFSGTAGKVEYEITSGHVDEETGAVRSSADILVNGLSYAAGDRGLHFAVFRKSTGELLDACWLNIFSRALSCTHDNH